MAPECTVVLNNLIENKTEEDTSNRSQLKQWLAALSVTLSMVTVGSVYGWTTTIINRLESGVDVPVKITTDDSSWLVSLTVIASMLGSFAAAFLADKLGRKICLLCTSIFYIIGWLIIIFTSSIPALYAARILQGIGVGMSYTTNPMYVSEIADINIRGALGTLIAVNVFTGSLITCSIGPFVSYKTLGIVSLSIPVLFFITFIFFPESPYFLAIKNRHKSAINSLIFFKNIDELKAQNELEIILNNINDERNNSEKLTEKIKHLLSLNNRKAFFIVFTLIVSQQFSGNFSTLQYQDKLFSYAKIGIDSSVATIIVTFVGLVSGTIATLTVEKTGRRLLLMISTFMCSITLFILAIYLYLKKININVNVINLMPVFAVVLFQISYQIGLGTLPNALVGELFPTNAKSIASAAITISDGILGFTVSKLYPDENHLYFGYAFFAISSFVAFIFVSFCIPETRNKSFSAIQDELSKHTLVYYKDFKNSR